MTITFNSWVTAVPELQEFAVKYFAKSIAGISLQDRIIQRLGLPPLTPKQTKETAEQKFVVQFWANIKDIFRACADSGAFDQQCILPLEGAATLPYFAQLKKLIKQEMEVRPGHTKWLESQRNDAFFKPPHHFPWTELGYGFDWGGTLDTDKKKPQDVGFSEFAIPKGSIVHVESITPIDKYHKKKQPAKK